jgi:hypothetical protein
MTSREPIPEGMSWKEFDVWIRWVFGGELSLKDKFILRRMNKRRARQ